MLSVRGLVRAIFDEQRPAQRRNIQGTEPSRVVRSGWDVNDPDSEPTYVPKRFEGEYNVCFRRKPLGVGLVPSTQLYGSWEVSSIQEKEGDDAPLVVKDGEVNVRSEITRGDVVIAVNFSCRKAQLPRAQLAAYLRQCTCPIVMTLRSPEIYGSFDSRSLSTAMYPDSMDNRQMFNNITSKVVARASSKQWRRSLEHDLAFNAQEAKREKIRKLAQALVDRDADKVQNAPAAGIADVLEWRELDSEFEVTFNETPLHMALAPSTRLYGSVEVYDPKHHAPTVQVGDVIMAVNGYSSMMHLSSDEVIDAIVELQAPVTLLFRRPVAYRNYLTTFFHTKRELSSQSTASAMFPPSPEYKKKMAKPAAKKFSKSGSLVAQSFIDTTPNTPPTKEIEDENEKRLTDFRNFAEKIGAMDQFKLWSGGETSGAGGRPLVGHQSAFLTEKHVQFLWKHLPNYLTCNQMELVFTTRVHGWNQLSFFSRLENKGPTLLVVQDEHDSIFGAFCPASWKRSKTVFGNGRAFVFSLSPRTNAYAWSGIDSSFMYTRRDAIFVGGGSKGIALCLQLDERRGFSHACTTFDSPPLVDYDNFRCETLEVWGFHGLKV
ncbi:hypothetical protein JM18_003606 [Phytophthora kernoviae]|uniref:TLDc domain-containing protein n=2 Tax=Phytophthora kernoviae TaxID=325452 RepID=A0A8T0M0Q8_9STRA|nr:hypothetical protein G195_004849 [Phytophthora kernoviae 00238/432]KAG2525962.1 hypothetical protein JM16_004132 [Phytophthora kernoviae]KAG2527645.1 hypothetical protein JM18_003606 [Phytophthora kernoviae]